MAVQNTATTSLIDHPGVERISGLGPNIPVEWFFQIAMEPPEVILKMVTRSTSVKTRSRMRSKRWLPITC